MKDPAEKLVDFLLSNGMGMKADRVILKSGSLTMGGWSRESLLAAVRKFFPAAKPADDRGAEALELLRWLSGREMSPASQERIEEFLDHEPKE
jgi:hypothetical protein